MKELFDDLLPHIPDIVRQVCVTLGCRLQKEELDGFAQRITLLLMDNDYDRLRSFRRDSTPQTWLFTVAKHDIAKQLRRQSKMLSFEDLLLDSFISPPDQEETLISEERERMLLDIVSKLTTSEKKLFVLLWEGMSATEIAKKLMIKKESVWAKKSSLIKKIRALLRQDKKID